MNCIKALGKIQKKYMAPPFGVYRLAYFLNNVFSQEVRDGLLQIDVFDCIS